MLWRAWLLFFLTSLSAMGNARFTRPEVGVGRDYRAAKVDPQRLFEDMAARRRFGWHVLREANQPVFTARLGRLLPKWQTWYDQTEFVEMFRELFSELSPDERKGRAPFSEARIHGVLKEQARRRLGPIIRFEDSRGLFHGPLPGVRMAFTLFSPEFIRHYLRNYAKVEACSPSYLKAFPPDFIPPDPNNFAPCFDAEFPRNAVMLKMVWAVDGKPLRRFDATDSGLEKMLEKGRWEVKELIPSDEVTDDEIYSVVEDGKKFRLMAMHAVTKETREWVWASFWWDREGMRDLGADKPGYLALLRRPFRNYKMCVSTMFDEGDPDPGQRLWRWEDLAASLSAVSRAVGKSTWCSNPHLETSFSRTNCIGCHQHSPVSFSLSTEQLRKNFPADFVFSFFRFRVSIGNEIRKQLPAP